MILDKNIIQKNDSNTSCVYIFIIFFNVIIKCIFYIGRILENGWVDSLRLNYKMDNWKPNPRAPPFVPRRSLGSLHLHGGHHVRWWAPRGRGTIKMVQAVLCIFLITTIVINVAFVLDKTRALSLSNSHQQSGKYYKYNFLNIFYWLEIASLLSSQPYWII